MCRQSAIRVALPDSDLLLIKHSTEKLCSICSQPKSEICADETPAPASARHGVNSIVALADSNIEISRYLSLHGYVNALINGLHWSFALKFLCRVALVSDLHSARMA